MMASYMKSTPRKMPFAKLAFALAMTVTAFALPARADDDEKPDARLEGYPSQVWLKEGGTGGTVGTHDRAVRGGMLVEVPVEGGPGFVADGQEPYVSAFTDDA